MPELSFCLPCYNDAASIGALVLLSHRILAAHCTSFELIVVDDASEDESSAVLARLERLFPDSLRVIRHPVNLGYGGALRSAFASARGDWVGYTDGDGQYDVEDLNRLLTLRQDGFDWVQGYKTNRGDSWLRIVVGRIYNAFVRLTYGISIRDVDCDFRIFRRAYLSRMNLRESTGAITVELVKKLELLGARVVECPVSHHQRYEGRSQFFRFSKVARTLVRLFFLRRHCARFLGNGSAVPASVAPHAYREKLARLQLELTSRTS